MRGIADDHMTSSLEEPTLIGDHQVFASWLLIKIVDLQDLHGLFFGPASSTQRSGACRDLMLPTMLLRAVDVCRQRRGLLTRTRLAVVDHCDFAADQRRDADLQRGCHDRDLLSIGGSAGLHAH